MSLTIHVDKPGILTTISVTGELTFDGIAEAIGAYYENPTRNVLWLMPHASFHMLQHTSVEKLATLLREFRKKALKGKTAIVSQESLSYGLARSFEIMMNLAGGDAVRDIMAFQSLENAIEWLDREDRTDPQPAV